MSVHNLVIYILSYYSLTLVALFIVCPIVNYIDTKQRERHAQMQEEENMLVVISQEPDEADIEL